MFVKKFLVLLLVLIVAVCSFAACDKVNNLNNDGGGINVDGGDVGGGNVNDGSNGGNTNEGNTDNGQNDGTTGDTTDGQGEDNTDEGNTEGQDGGSQGKIVQPISEAGGGGTYIFN